MKEKEKSKVHFLLFLAVSCFFLIWLHFFSLNIPEEEIFPAEMTGPEKEETYSLLFVGDIMLDRGVRYMVEKHGKGDYAFPFLEIAGTLQKGDLLFGNLESVISDKGRNVGSLYSFRADPKAMDGLSYADFNIVSLANNHALDYTGEALEDTMKRLRENEIAYTGAGFNKEEAHSPSVITLGETKIGFLGYAEFLQPYGAARENIAGITEFTEGGIKEDIKKAKEETDLLVISFHYGEEYATEPNIRQREISRKAIDYGADLVIGHHPHVTQPVENYNGKYIAYSLGNFIFDQSFSNETMRGFILKVEIRGKEIDNVEKIHYKLNEFYQPEVMK